MPNKLFYFILNRSEKALHKCNKSQKDVVSFAMAVKAVGFSKQFKVISYRYPSDTLK